jgi:flagellar protein FliL
MADKTDDKSEAAPKKKGKGKLILFIALPVLLLGSGGGVAAYGMSAGWFSAKPHGEDEDTPRLVPKSEEKRASLSGGGEGEGGHGGGGEGESSASHEGLPTPKGEGGDKYASNYYPMEKEFTSNLKDSVHFIQVGIAISTPYDERVLENIKTHEIAIRSAILMSLGETTEDEVFTAEGKQHIQDRLVKGINGVLKQKEGFGGVSNVYFTNFIVQ